MFLIGPDILQILTSIHAFSLFLFSYFTSMAFAAAQTGPRPVLLQIEDQFNKRIDDDVGKLVDCFTDIVKVGEVSKKNTFIKTTMNT